MFNRRVLATAIGAVAVVGVLASCSSGVSGSAQGLANSIQEVVDSASAAASAIEKAAGESATSESEATETTETSAPAEAEPVTRAVDKTGWWGGFAITVGEVTATQGFGDAADLAIELTYENLGTQPWYAPTPTAEVDGSVIESFLDNTPEVPAGGKTNAELAVVVLGDDDGQVDLEAAIDAVSLVFGDAADNQTFIPLAASAEVTSVEPKDLAVTGTLTQGEVLVDVVSGSLEPSYESGEKDKSLVNLRIKVSCGPDCSEYGYNVGRENFALTAPDGTSVDSRRPQPVLLRRDLPGHGLGQRGQRADVPGRVARDRRLHIHVHRPRRGCAWDAGFHCVTDVANPPAHPAGGFRRARPPCAPTRTNVRDERELCGDPDHHVSPLAAGVDIPVRVDDLGEWERAVDHHRELPGLDELPRRRAARPVCGPTFPCGPAGLG